MAVADLGTSGVPTIVGHALEELCDAMVAEHPAPDSTPVWATLHDIRFCNGLRIFLRAIVGGGSLVLSEPGEPMSDYVARLASRGVTHISGASSHWRKLLTSGAVASLAPRYVCVSGETADRFLFDELKRAFPGASTDFVHASTEAGIGFDVNDGRDRFSSQGAHTIVGALPTIDAATIA